MRTPPEAINNNGGSGNSCSPSKSSSRSSSLSSFSPSSPVIPTPSARKFMEEVWKDISLASLRDHSNNTLSSATTNYHPADFCGTILQDFLPRSSNKVLPTVETATFLASLAPPPATKLSMNSISGFDFAYLESRSPIRPNLQLPCHASVTAPPNSFVSSLNYSPVGVLGSSSVLFPSYCKKRVQEYGDEPSDQRYKRMIKNRESAARSRAKKQESFSLFFFSFFFFFPRPIYIYIYIK
jgi:hypothetical protein